MRLGALYAGLSGVLGSSEGGVLRCVSRDILPQHYLTIWIPTACETWTILTEWEWWKEYLQASGDCVRIFFYHMNGQRWSGQRSPLELCQNSRELQSGQPWPL